MKTGQNANLWTKSFATAAIVGFMVAATFVFCSAVFCSAKAADKSSDARQSPQDRPAASDKAASEKAAADKAAADKGTDAPTAFDPTDSYVPQSIQGWKVLVNKRLLVDGQRELRERTLRHLEDHLYRVTFVLPAEALAKVRNIPIWVELSDPKFPCMCYHESAGWLSSHGLNPAKAGGVEIANPKNFLIWTHEQPWMVLHELAHGFHDQVLGFDNATVERCYRQAVDAKSYESVLHWNADKVRHYALTNDKEYFAECTEAYFGTNDFYPFVRAELKTHDPKAYELMEQMWGVHGAIPKMKKSD